MLQWISLVVGGSGLLAGIGALILVPAQKRKAEAESGVSKADAAATLSAASVAILAPMQAEMTRLNERLARASQRADDLAGQLQLAQTEVSDLRGQVERLTKDLEASQAEVQRLKGAA